MKFNGLEVVIDDSLAEYDRVKRFWRERLLSLTPWRAYRLVPRPPPYLVHQARKIVYTTSRGSADLWQDAKWRSETGDRCTGYLPYSFEPTAMETIVEAQIRLQSEAGLSLHSETIINKEITTS